LNARDVVYWYNNHPKYEAYQLDLTNKRNVVIIGNGNVAIDISRILLKDPAELVNTEISENALKALLESKIRNVTLIGRRGFTHSAFALK
jgi:ferredoxin/flavodoxin---NADP+ reductase